MWAESTKIFLTANVLISVQIICFNFIITITRLNKNINQNFVPILTKLSHRDIIKKKTGVAHHEEEKRS